MIIVKVKVFNVLTLAICTGVVTTLSGDRNSPGYMDGIGTFVKFGTVNVVAVGMQGQIYVADAGTHLIRKISSTGAYSVNITILDDVQRDASIDCQYNQRLTLAY